MAGINIIKIKHLPSMPADDTYVANSVVGERYLIGTFRRESEKHGLYYETVVLDGATLNFDDSSARAVTSAAYYGSLKHAKKTHKRCARETAQRIKDGLLDGRSMTQARANDGT